MTSPDRITRYEMLILMAQVVSKRSTCSRSQVGVIVAIESRPLVSGYNGAPAGLPHCDHTCSCTPDVIHSGSGDVIRAIHEKDCPAGEPCTIAVHAEANAIAFAAKNGVRLERSTLFSTLEPCLACSMLIINAGIVEVVYSAPYRIHDGTTLLRTAGVRVWPSVRKE